MPQSAEESTNALSCRAPRAATTARNEAWARWESAFRPDEFALSRRVLQRPSERLSRAATRRETRLPALGFFLLSRSYLFTRTSPQRPLLWKDVMCLEVSQRIAIKRTSERNRNCPFG